MSHPQVLSPHPDTSRCVYDSGRDPEIASTEGGTSHDPYPNHHDAPVFEIDSEEETTTHETPEGRSRARSVPSNRIVSSGEPIPILTSPGRTGPRVRFWSRVRISAGMGRRRRRLSDGLSSSASSRSDSPSSSISAPLRTNNTGNVNGWGPLGSRVKSLGSQAAAAAVPAPTPPAPLSPSQGGYANGGKGSSSRSGSGDGSARTRFGWTWFLGDGVDEHTHLVTPASRHSYVGNRYVHGDWYQDEEEEREEEEWWRERLVDEAFGKWPGRLLNRHWWRWYLESVFCCLCDPDEERERYISG